METQVKYKTEQGDAPPSPIDTGGATSSTADRKLEFQKKIRESNLAIQNADFHCAIQLYTEAMTLDPGNHILHSNRSAAYMKTSQYEKALQDAQEARRLQPKWPKAYFREGVALQCLARETEAMASFAAGLAEDPKSPQLLHGLVETALNSSLKDEFVPLHAQLQRMKLDQSPFVIISVIGQSLLARSEYAAALVLLESALRIGTCSLKLRGSVFSSLSSAHWGVGNIDKAIACMQQDLAIVKSLGDAEGECRAHGNLGAAYFSKGSYREALQHHRSQLVLTMRLKDRKGAATTLSHLGHVYTAVGDYSNALSSHKQCVLLLKQSKNRLLEEAREIGNVGAVYLAMGDFSSALECHNEHLKLAKRLGNKVEEARAFSNIGSAYHYRRDFEKAIAFHNHVLNIALELDDRTLEARAYAGLGHASRCMSDLSRAKYYHEKQLDNSLVTRDKVAEGRSCSNLGIVYHQFGDFDAALKLHKAHLRIAKELGDRASQGRAYGNIGNAYSALGQYELAVRFHKQELEISMEVNDKHSESSTHGNLAVAYQWLQNYDKALQHYATHLQMAKELHDTPSESRALNNLGNFHSLRKHYAQAIPYYEQYLVLSQELGDAEGEGKVCHRLGYAHYCIGSYKEAVRYYEQDLTLARDADNQGSIARAYCNLGLAHKALGDLRRALDCQRQCLAIARQTDNLIAKFNALGNIGDVLVKLAEVDEALAMFNEQVSMARSSRERRLEAIAYANLGATYRLVGQHDKALAFHTRELAICQERGDVKAECRAHGNTGNVHMSLGNYGDALRSYSAQLERARELKDCAIEAHAYANLGLTKMNMGQFEEAIGFFEQQLALFEQMSGSLSDRGRAFGNLADCYEALNDYEEAVKCYERHLAIAQSGADKLGQMRAYRGLGNAHRAMGNLQQALVCFEKRLVIAHDIDKADAKSSAYGELGCLHSLLGNFEQAILCLQHQVAIAREKGDKVGEGEAVCGLGGVYQHMGEFDKALEHHQLDLHIALETGSAICQCRAYGNIGLAYESAGNFEKALEYQQQHLNIATRTNDRAAVTLAFSSLGRVNHALGNYEKSVEYLEQGLLTAEQLGHQEDEAKIRQRLGLALWGQHNLEKAREQLYRATELFETIRRDAPYNNDYKLSLFDLQTASYQALQRVLVALGHHDDALVVAERGRTRAFVDLLLERQLVDGADSWYNSLDSSPVTLEQILGHVRQQRATVVYYSLAAGYLYSWVISPDHGIMKFHQYSINELETSGSDPEDTQSMKSFRSSLSASGTSVLDGYVGHVREALGIESHLSTSRASLYRSSSTVSETESEAEDLWQHQLEEIGDKLNAENDRTGFLRMVNRSHVWNSSTYSLSSMLSGSTSVTGSFVPSRVPSKMSSKPPLSALYELLIAPLEDVLPSSGDACKELVLVLQGDLYLVPFALLKGSQAAPCLFERFSLLVVPSIRALETNQVISKHSRYNPNCTGAVVIGNPKLPSSLTTRWQWGSLPGAEQECKVVAEMLGGRMITGSAATKTKVIAQIERAEVLHFATHISWKLAAIIVSPGNDFSSSSSTVTHGNFERMDLNSGDLDTSFDTPPLSDFLLTAADILNMKISAKLVVLSSGHSDDRAGRINADGVVGLTRAFLATGAQCILFSLWPLPDGATRIFIKIFYTSLLQGVRPSHALSGAMKAVQNSRQFSHPANWAGWVLIGSDVQLSSQVALMAHSLCQLLRTPTKSREAMRVVLHLVEKSLQRIRNGQRNPMYTTQHSIEKKVGPVTGWRDLLTAVGFRLEPAYNGLPPAVFFPTSDPADRLMQCSASLQALFGLGIPTLVAFSKMLDQQEVGEAMTALIRDVNAKSTHETNPQTQVNVQLWGAPGCHEFLASLGFDLVDVGRDEVTIKAGKQANKRTLTFALQALAAIFDTQQAPRSLQLDNASSMESLVSSSSNTSTSNFSKGSSPMTSPSVAKRRSFFNPAEVDQLPSATSVHKHMHHQPGEPRPPPDISLQLSRQTLIRNKYSSPSASDLSDTNAHDSSTDTAPRPRLTVLSSSSRSRHSSGKPAFPVGPPPPNIYSTSDSEDASEFVLSRVPSRSSFASQASTVTLKSSSGMRRNRIRSSVTSTRSSASDRTITNEFLNLSDDLSAEGSTGGVASDSKRTEPTRNDSASHLDNESRNPARHKTPDRRQQKTASSSVLHATGDDANTAAAMLDPTYVAQKILAETRPQRQALELMQKWSVDQLQQKRLAGAQNDNDKTREDILSDIHDCHLSLHDPVTSTDCKQTKDCTSSSLDSSNNSVMSPTGSGLDHRTKTKTRGGPEMTKSDATYTNIPFSDRPSNVSPVTSSLPSDQRRAFHRVESATRNTARQINAPGQNISFGGCGFGTSDGDRRSSRIGNDLASSSMPWLNKPSPTADGQTTDKKSSVFNGRTETRSSKYTDSTFCRSLPVIGLKPFPSSVSMAPPSGSPQTQHGSQTRRGENHHSAEELHQPGDWKDLAANKNTIEHVLPPDGQAPVHDNDGSVDVKCTSALKSVNRPNKQKTVKFQDEIEMKSSSNEEPPTKYESCDDKKAISTPVSNELRDNVPPQKQLGERCVAEIGKTSQDSPVMYKPPPPYPGPGRNLPSAHRTPPGGAIESCHIDGPVSSVSNGYREHSLDTFRNQYNDHVSAMNGYNDRSHCPVRPRDVSPSGITPVDDEMCDLNSRQNLKRMSMHMYTSSDDSTASAAHRLNGFTRKRVTENFQRFQTRSCNGDAVPNPSFTSQPPFGGMQNGAPNFVANYIERGDRNVLDRRRDYDWECRTRVPMPHGEEAPSRTRHTRDPITMQSSQC